MTANRWIIIILYLNITQKYFVTLVYVCLFNSNNYEIKNITIVEQLLNNDQAQSTESSTSCNIWNKNLFLRYNHSGWPQGILFLTYPHDIRTSITTVYVQQAGCKVLHFQNNIHHSKFLFCLLCSFNIIRMNIFYYITLLINCMFWMSVVFVTLFLRTLLKHKVALYNAYYISH